MERDIKFMIIFYIIMSILMFIMIFVAEKINEKEKDLCKKTNNLNYYKVHNCIRFLEK